MSNFPTLFNDFQINFPTIIVILIEWTQPMTTKQEDEIVETWCLFIWPNFLRSSWMILLAHKRTQTSCNFFLQIPSHSARICEWVEAEKKIRACIVYIQIQKGGTHLFTFHSEMFHSTAYVASASRQHKQAPFGVTFIYFGWKQSSNCRLRCPRQTHSERVLEM